MCWLLSYPHIVYAIIVALWFTMFLFFRFSISTIKIFITIPSTCTTPKPPVARASGADDGGARLLAHCHWCWWSSLVAAYCRLPPLHLESTGPGLPYVAKCMFQVFQMFHLLISHRLILLRSRLQLKQLMSLTDPRRQKMRTSLLHHLALPRYLLKPSILCSPHSSLVLFFYQTPPRKTFPQE